MISSNQARVISLAASAFIAGLIFTPAARSQSTAVSPGQPITESLVNQAFGLVACELISLDVPSFHDGVLRLTVPFRGVEYELSLSPHSNRSDRYEVRVHDGSGRVRNIAPGPVLTKRGIVVGLEGSVVTASLAEGLVAEISLPDGSAFHVVPVIQEIEGAPAALHAVYHEDSIVTRPEDVCGVDGLTSGPVTPPINLGGSTKRDCAFLWMCEVACETDYEYFLDLGSSTTNVENRINEIFNAVNVQYERDVSITHEITLINIYTSDVDAYTTTDAGGLLDQFRAEWSANHSGDSRDIAHMFSGRNFDGNISGVAWVGVICSSSLGYSLVENYGGAGCRSDLSAHELGHNWSAGHCSCNNTMNGGLTCTNVFSAATITQISGYRNNKVCLSCVDPVVCQIDLGFGGPGTGVLTVCGGSLASGTTADLEFTNGYLLGRAFIMVGTSNNPTPFKGGLLVPVPGTLVGPFTQDFFGAFSVPGIQGGGGFFTFFLQVIYEDFSLPTFVGLSNAVSVTKLP